MYSVTVQDSLVYNLSSPVIPGTQVSAIEYYPGDYVPNGTYELLFLSNLNFLSILCNIVYSEDTIINNWVNLKNTTPIDVPYDMKSYSVILQRKRKPFYSFNNDIPSENTNTRVFSKDPTSKWKYKIVFHNN